MTETRSSTLNRSSWPGIAVRRTASLPLAYARPSTSLLPKKESKTWITGSSLVKPADDDGYCGRLRAQLSDRRPLRLLLLLFPERQQPLAGRAADHAGNADRDRAHRRGRDAAERNRADADLAPEIEVAPRIRAFRLQFFDRGERVLAHGAELHGVGGLHHFGERHLHRIVLNLELAAQIFAQAGIPHRVACERIAGHAAHGELVDGVAALAPGQHCMMRRIGRYEPVAK